MARYKTLRRLTKETLHEGVRVATTFWGRPVEGVLSLQNAREDAMPYWFLLQNEQQGYHHVADLHGYKHSYAVWSVRDLVDRMSLGGLDFRLVENRGGNE